MDEGKRAGEVPFVLPVNPINGILLAELHDAKIPTANTVSLRQSDLSKPPSVITARMDWRADSNLAIKQ